MKKILLYITIATGAALAACNHDKASTPVKSNEVNNDLANAGREAALRAFQYDSCSQARDSALLEIKATEQKLIMEGMPNSAKSFVAGAQAVIDSLLQK